MLYFREVLAMRGTPQTIVANFVNTGRQHMLQETSNELLGADSHGLRLGTAQTLIPKGNLTVVGRDYSASDQEPRDCSGNISPFKVTLGRRAFGNGTSCLWHTEILEHGVFVNMSPVYDV